MEDNNDLTSFACRSRSGINLEFYRTQKSMLIAVKDALRIQVTVDEHKVNIAMPGMEDVIWLWDSWIKEEEKQAERFLRSQFSPDPYLLLSEYFEKKGWEITGINHKN